MTISLQGVVRKIVFAAVVLLPAVLFVRVAAHPWLADRLAAHPSRESLQRASEYEPANAERYYMYARYLQLVERDFAAAAWNFRAATAVNPHRGRYWIDLATTLNFLGDDKGEGVALHEAVRRDPTNPTVALDAANFFLARGEEADAVREYRVAIDHNAGLAPLVFERLWQYSHDADFIMREALPSGTNYFTSLMALFLAQDQAKPAATLWQRWMTSAEDVPVTAAFPYIEYLCRRADYEHASEAWQDLARHSPELRARVTPGNLIANSGFEDPILDGGFEWRYRQNKLAALELDTTRFHEGGSSLRIDFSGESGGDAGIAQLVALPPDQAFTFRGFIRAEAIYSPHGPRFSVVDMASGSVLYNSEESVGTSSWLERRGVIAGTPIWRLVAVQITREPESHITGRVWIDDLSLTAGGDR